MSSQRLQVTQIFTVPTRAYLLSTAQLADFLIREAEIVTEANWNLATETAGPTADNIRIIEQLERIPAHWCRDIRNQFTELTEYQSDALVTSKGNPVRVDSYILLSRLKPGGMGETYLAYDGEFGRLVVIKTSKSISTQSLALFEREMNVLGQVVHSHVARLYAKNCQEDFPYMAMEFVPGTDLADFTKASLKTSLRPIDWIVERLIPVAEAVDEIHAKKIVHRDIKPSNLILHEDDKRVVLVDFGISRQQGLTLTSDRDGMRGSAPYAPPEQWLDPSNVSGAADIYAFGVTLFELLTGHPPFEGDVYQLMKLHSEAPRPDPRRLRSEIPEHIAMLIREMMAIKPTERPTAREVVARLSSINAYSAKNLTATVRFSPGASTRIRSFWGLTRSRMIISIAATVLSVVLVALLIYSVTGNFKSRLPALQGPASDSAGGPIAQTASAHNHPPELSSTSTDTNTIVISTEPTLTAEDAVYQFDGWGSSWSHDGKRLVRQHDDQLQIVDLETGNSFKTGVAGSDPAWSPQPGGPIAFVQVDQKATELSLLAPDGNEKRRVSSGLSGLFMPNWSGDGKTLYFWHYDSRTLHSVDIGGDVSRPRVACEGPWPSVSPDEKYVAYQDGEELLVKTLDDVLVVRHRLPRLRGSPWRGLLSGWSPNSRLLSFGSVGNGEGLWLLELQTRRVWKVADGGLTAPRWSPDGARVSVDDRGRPANRVLVFNAPQFQSIPKLIATPQTADDTRVVVTSTEPLLSAKDLQAAQHFEGRGWAYGWSPDGQKLVRIRTLVGATIGQLEIVDLSTGAVSLVVPRCSDPAWSPRANGPIAFIEGEERELGLISPAGIRRKTKGPVNGVFAPSWSEKGEKLNFFQNSTGTVQSLDMDDPTAEPVTLTSCPSAYPAVSPDGHLLAFHQPDADELIVKELATQRIMLRHRISHCRVLLLSWSQDGSLLGFGSIGGGEGLWMCDIRAHQVWKVANGAHNMPRWSPDGRKVAVDDRAREEILIFDAHKLVSSSTKAGHSVSKSANVE